MKDITKERITSFFQVGTLFVSVIDPTLIHEDAVGIISNKKLKFGQVRQVTAWLAGNVPSNPGLTGELPLLTKIHVPSRSPAALVAEML